MNDIDDKNQVRDDQNLGQPMDPTTDYQAFIGDENSMAGITQTHGNPPNQADDPLANQVQDDPSNTISPSSSTVHYKVDQALNAEDVGLDHEDINAVGNETIDEASPPHVLGEQSASGDMPDPGSDDDTLNMSHQVGLRLDEDEENPQPLNTAADVAAAEKSLREK
jgi:hypothetical protein